VEAQVREAIGTTLQGLARYDEAEPDLRKALAIRRAALPAGHPDIADSLNDLGLLLQAQNKLVEAEPLFREALKIYRALPAAQLAVAGCLNDLALLLMAQNKLSEAESLYRKALEINPRLPGVHYELAEAILESSPNDAQVQAEAEKELEAAVKSDGDSAKVECVYARIAARRSDLDAAYAHYSRAFALNPGEVEAQIGLGRLLANMQKPEEAAKYLRMAVKSDPLNEQAHYRLASVCRSLQLKDESEKEFRLFQEIKQTKKRLRDLYRQMGRKPPGQEDQIPDAEQ